MTTITVVARAVGPSFIKMLVVVAAALPPILVKEVQFLQWFSEWATSPPTPSIPTPSPAHLDSLEVQRAMMEQRIDEIENSLQSVREDLTTTQDVSLSATAATNEALLAARYVTNILSQTSNTLNEATERAQAASLRVVETLPHLIENTEQAFEKLAATKHQLDIVTEAFALKKEDFIKMTGDLIKLQGTVADMVTTITVLESTIAKLSNENDGQRQVIEAKNRTIHDLKHEAERAHRYGQFFKQMAAAQTVLNFHDSQGLSL